MALVHVLIAAGVAAVHVGGVLCALSAAGRARSAEGAIAWALALVFLPWFALPAYAVFGPPDTDRLGRTLAAARATSLRAVAADTLARAAPPPADPERRAALERLAPLPVLHGAPPRLLADVATAFEAIFAAIDRADGTVLVQFYIVRDDRLGRTLKDRLVARARAGVKVLFLYDRVGCHGTPRRYWRELAAAGVEVRPFEVKRPLARLLRLNFRNHRKVVVADGRMAVVGGPNVGVEYLGEDPRLGAWRDTSVALAGPAATALAASFLEDWLQAGGAPAPVAPADTDRAAPVGVPTLVLPTGPADRLPACTLFLCHLIGEARVRLWLASPYFVPDLDVLTALKVAALRGVDVRILMPDRADHLIVWLAAFAYVDEALRAGIRIYRYADGFMHQKVCLVDEWAASVGTVNLDSRSLRQNYEISAIVFDAGFCSEVAAMLERDFSASRLYDTAAFRARSRTVKVLAPAARLLGPLL